MSKESPLIYEQISNNYFFKNFSKEEIKKILSISEIKEFEKDSYIVKEGDDSNDVFFILEGKVDVIKVENYEDDKIEHKLATLTVGDSIGEMGLLNAFVRSADVRAVEKTIVLDLPVCKIKEISPEILSIEAKLKINLAMKISDYVRKSNFSKLEDVKKYRAEISHIKSHDLMTGLPNKNFLAGYIDKFLSEKNVTKSALMFIKLSDLKEILNSMGNEIFDKFVQACVQRINSFLGQDDLLFKFEFNQFAIFTTNVDSVTNYAKKILHSFSKALIIDAEEIFTNAYIGIAFSPNDGENSADLFKSAGLALDYAKITGPGTFSIYDKKFNSLVEERRILIKDFRVAFQKSQFKVYYQPQINLNSGQVVGAEALIRWPHPEKGMISPAVFIPILEQSGLIVDLGNWIFKEACLQSKRWGDIIGNKKPVIAINLSALQFRQKNLIILLKEMIAEANINPECIEIEVTESAMMSDMEETIEKLKQLSDLGFVIAIDDFGTGYSSLSYLKKMPIDKIKIDQSFIKDLSENQESRDIVKYIVLLSKSLKLKVIAEGIEKEEHRAFLQEINCDEGQGYLFGKAMSELEFEQNFLKSK